MDMPISRASAYMKRNRTTHSWCGDWGPSNDLMSRSCPPSRTLEDHMLRARAAQTSMASSYHKRGSNASDSAVPVVVRSKSSTRGYTPTSSASSPGHTTTGGVRIPGRRQRNSVDAMDGGRPSSAYSYDGGFFVTANNASKDFFVINPEWVSEDETVKKLSGGQEAKKVMSHAAQRGGSSASGQAPPPVITWNSYRKGKRSKSAPPPKHRNPITWVDPVE